MKENIILEGNISVKSALESKYTKLSKIMVDKKKHDKDTNYILALAYNSDVEVIKCERSEIEPYCSGKTHGGLIGFVLSHTYQSIEDLKDDDFIAIIEGIEDPFNFGHVIRSLYASGVSAIITTNHTFETRQNIICKSSAGASEKIKMIISSDLGEDVRKLKEDFKIICANRSDHSIIMYDYDYTQKVCIAIGGEKRGLSKDVLALSDQDVYIPYNQNFRNALSASSASTILAYEVLRQRLNK